MSQFGDRQKAFEEKFRRDQEHEFKIVARRNKLLGLWAAEKMGLEGEEAEAYAKEVVAADFEEPGPEDVIRRVHTDLNEKGVEISEHLIRREMERLYRVAAEELAEKE